MWYLLTNITKNGTFPFNPIFHACPYFDTVYVVLFTHLVYGLWTGVSSGGLSTEMIVIIAVVIILLVAIVVGVIVVVVCVRKRLETFTGRASNHCKTTCSSFCHSLCAWFQSSILPAQLNFYERWKLPSAYGQITLHGSFPLIIELPIRL